MEDKKIQIKIGDEKTIDNVEPSSINISHSPRGEVGFVIKDGRQLATFNGEVLPFQLETIVKQGVGDGSYAELTVKLLIELKDT